MPVCENKECQNQNNELASVEANVVDTYFHDLNNGEQYHEEEHVPSGHSYRVIDIVVKTYECPDCGESYEGDEEYVEQKIIDND